MSNRVDVAAENRIRVDPRLKLAHILIISIMSIIIKSDYVYLLHIISLCITLVFLKDWIYGAKFLSVYLCYYILLIVIGCFPENTSQATIKSFVFLFMRMHSFVAIGIISTKTMTTSELIGAFQKLRLPKSFILPFAVTQRFIPTFIKEMGYIRDAMKMRGITLSLFGITKAPLKTLEYILVPLLMRSVKISDELSASAVVRGIENPKNRTEMYMLKLRKTDCLYFVFIALCNLSFLVIDK